MKRKLTVGIAALTNDFSLKGNRTYGEELVPEYLIHILDLSSFQHFEYFKTELEPFFSLYQKRNRKNLWNIKKQRSQQKKWMTRAGKLR